jgi:ApbE superfamily uncharacterized protein (UPF0280 family)
MSGWAERPAAARLAGDRLELRHGPIHLVIGADGARDLAFAAAWERFQHVLNELTGELQLLRRESGAEIPTGLIARRMHAATLLHRPAFITPMAAVAGAVAEEMLSSMIGAAPLTRAWVNNGGDIALHLAPGQSIRAAMVGLKGEDFGRVRISAADRIGGIATSGFGGRSHTFGIADSVTVLACSAAMADAAATLIANAVDLPGHTSIARVPADTLQPDTDLGSRLVTQAVGPLVPTEIDRALDSGLATAEAMRARGLITAAALFLRGRSRLSGWPANTPKDLAHA